MPSHCRVITIIVLLLYTDDSEADLDPRVIGYDDLRDTAHSFSEPTISHYSQLVFNSRGGQSELIVGARDALYRMTVDRLELLEKANWKAADSKISMCHIKGQTENDCKNYVKVLLLTNGNELFACGTNAFSPLCTWREPRKINRILKETHGRAKCPYNPGANVTSLITEDGLYFAGTPLDFTGTDSAIVRDGDPVKLLRTLQYDPKWLNEPQFIGSFETDSYVYFLFREVAVEFMNCGKAIYSRIARVCKKDNGDQRRTPKSWTTFVKARLNCSMPGEYPFYFDEIQGFTYLPDEGMVYATFTTPRNSIAGSAICLFNLSAINAAFNGPFKHQKSMGSAWESVPNDNSKQCSSYENPETYPLSVYQLADNAVQAVTKSPVYQHYLERIVHIAVDEVMAKRPREKTIHVLYISTEDNIIKKISVLSSTMTPCVLEVWKPLSDSSNRILSMYYFEENESLFIGTEKEVLRIPSQHCDRYKSKQACLDSKDPYCGWNERTFQCSPPPDNNPLTVYWNQIINECPSFSNSIPGGWSKWSSWFPCDQVNSSHGTGTGDQCFCSTRQCNNPAPQNGGADCEGARIQVANCTIHGGWTEWSEWSACSQSCGKEAVKIRRRTCTNPAPAYGGRVCVGQESDVAVCFDNPPCPPPVSANPCPLWKPWSECSAKCGDGYQFRTRECTNRPDGCVNCPGEIVEIRKCNLRPCPIPQRVSEVTSWECSRNEMEERYRIWCEVNFTSLKVEVFKEERNSSEEVSCFDLCDAWSNWTECDHFNMQERYRKCVPNNKGRKCRCEDYEKRSCLNYQEASIVSAESNGSVSTTTLLLSCFLSFILGLCCVATFCYYKFKKERHSIPSSPLYATKQNFYVNVPLRESPKRTPSFTKNSILSNGSSGGGAPKVFAKPLISNGNATAKAIVKPMEYDTATIKRKSNNIKIGYE